MAKNRQKIRTRAKTASLDRPYDPPPTLTVTAGRIKTGREKLDVGKQVNLHVTGKVVEESIDTYVPPSERKRRFRVEINRVKVLGKKK